MAAECQRNAPHVAVAQAKVEGHAPWGTGTCLAPSVAQVFQPAVSQACSLPGSDKPCRSGFGFRHAEWNSAIQQTESLRYPSADPSPWAKQARAQDLRDCLSR